MGRLNRADRVRGIARTVVALASCLVLVGTGYSWNVLHELTSGLTKSDALAGNEIG